MKQHNFIYIKKNLKLKSRLVNTVLNFFKKMIKTVITNSGFKLKVKSMIGDYGF